MGVLGRIIERKKERLALARSRAPLAEVKARAMDAEAARDFAGAIRRQGGPIRLIAEVKRASPSRGLIRADFDPAAIARIYERRAAAVSVLTEEDFFQGSLSYIALVRAATGRPVLRKDFIIDEYQLYESRAAGADAVLLIAAALGRAQAAEYVRLSADLGMAALFEVHNGGELESALGAGASIIGVNNRDLTTLKVEIETTFRLKAGIPAGKAVVSESGISRREDVLRLEAAGVDAVLIGTAFMEAGDIGRKVDELMGGGG
jgi:indole-3-glycerol phosphate synthase